MFCNVYRGSKIESLHSVYAVALNEDNNIIFSSGNPDHLTCIRSSLKPFQASTAILIGATKTAKFSTKEIALMCASHSGEQIHIDAAKSMMKKLNYKMSVFECGSHPPFNNKDRKKLYATSKNFTPFHNNCSGKHAGMLSIARQLNVRAKGYIKKNHPVQQAIIKQLKRLTNKNFLFSIDGCSAPTPFMSLMDIAKLYQMLGSTKFPELYTAYQAMYKHPYYIGGKNRFDTDFAIALNGRGICKAGGEAIRGIVVNTKKYGRMGIALKVLDGNQRAIESATMAILNHLNILETKEKEYLKKYETTLLYNLKKIHIGKIKTEIIIN